MDNKQFTIRIENLVPILVDVDAKIPCDNDGYSINFDFDEEWSNYLVKTALFVCGGKTHTSVFEGNVCKIPRIKDGTICYIGVVTGEITEENEIPDKRTSKWCEVEAEPTITSIADEPIAPSPDVYTEFMALLNKYIIEGGGGLTEEEVKAIVATETEGKVDKQYAPVAGVHYAYTTYFNIDEEQDKQTLTKFSDGSTEGIAYCQTRGRLPVGDPEYASHATNKRYVDNATAPIADNTNKIADHEKRIENLESTLLTFIEDGESAYEKTVPVGVGKNAVLSSIGGATKTSKNLLDPSAFGFPVNEDGSFHYELDYGGGTGGISHRAAISLSAGTYYLSYKEANLVGDFTHEGYGFFVGDGFLENPIVLDKQTDCSVGFVGGGVGEISVDLYIMLSTDPNAEFEPYFEGERYGKVTAVESYGSNLFDYTQIFHTKNGTIEQIPTGLRVVGYNVITTLTPEQFLAMTGLKEGDTFTYSAIRKVISGGSWGGGDSGGFVFYGNDGNKLLTFGGGGKEGYISNTRTIPTPFNNITHAPLHIFGENGKTMDFTEITITKGEVAAPYEPYSAEPIDTFNIPQEIQTLDGYGKSGFVLDLESKTATYEGKTTDVSAYLTGYDKFKALYVQGGGKVRFVSADKLPVPSEITYVKAKE